MSATVHHIYRSDALLTKQQLADHLGRSTRWIEMQVRAGMPSIEPTRRFPHRRFRLGDVNAWLADSETKPAAPDRITILERQMATLTATVEQLQRKVG